MKKYTNRIKLMPKFTKCMQDLLSDNMTNEGL